MTNRWLLPENIADVLPLQAMKVEHLRRMLLDLFKSYGYELVTPPMLEYLESLLTASGSDMNLQIFKITDQLSGRTMGLRADITTQVARIDAHILNHSEVTRLCYAGTTLQTKVAPGIFSREQLQLGAEIYGHQGIEADIEILSLMLNALQISQIGKITLDLSHAGILRAFLQGMQINAVDVTALHQALQAKNKKLINSLCSHWSKDQNQVLISLLELSGEAFHVIDSARQLLPNSSAYVEAIGALEFFCKTIKQMHPQVQLNIDLADLDGFEYHTGLMCAAYVENYPVAIARGGRYDEVGSAFGRARPATGFSFDLFVLSHLTQIKIVQKAILAPWVTDSKLLEVIDSLRKSGEIVVQMLPNQMGSDSIYEFDRKLIIENDQWKVISQ